MSMTIWKEALQKVIVQLNKNGYGTSQIESVLDRCTHPPEVGGAEPVAWAATDEDGKVVALGFNQSKTRFDTPLYTQATAAARPVLRQTAGGLPEGWVAVPREPSDEHLMSMALRYDHGVGLRPQEEIASAMRSMRQLYEEATGQGFYAIDGSNSERYRQVIPVADHAGLSAARLPDGWPWEPWVRRSLARLLMYSGVARSNQLARWLESAGQKEKQG